MFRLEHTAIIRLKANIFVNNQLDAQFFFSCTFFPILYMFRVPLCSSWGESIALIRHLVYVTLCRWPSSVQVWVEGSSIQTCTLDGYCYLPLAAGSSNGVWQIPDAVDTVVFPPDDEWWYRPWSPWSPPSLLYDGYRVFLGGKERPVRDADPSPPSIAAGQERVELYLYSPCGPYGLYRASVPVQGCTLPLQ